MTKIEESLCFPEDSAAAIKQGPLACSGCAGMSSSACALST